MPSQKICCFCLNLVENKNINKVLTERLLLFSRNLLAGCICLLSLQTYESDYIHLVICSSELTPISVTTLFERVRLIALSQSVSLICPFYGKKVPQINFCWAKHCLLSFIIITVIIIHYDYCLTNQQWQCRKGLRKTMLVADKRIVLVCV